MDKKEIRPTKTDIILFSIIGAGTIVAGFFAVLILVDALT